MSAVNSAAVPWVVIVPWMKLAMSMSSSNSPMLELLRSVVLSLFSSLLGAAPFLIFAAVPLPERLRGL
jgi:hypothetical protein